MSKKKNRPHGHYCKICGEHKANEKFSGKGHAAHICKACSRLSAAEKAAAMDMNRLMDFPMRRLTDSEKKWLKAKMHDQCPEVADTAREVFNACFPHAERNAMKKQLVINTLSFEVHTEVYDGYGDMEMADCRFTIDRKSRVLTMTDFQAEDGEQSVTLEGGQRMIILRIIFLMKIYTGMIWRKAGRICQRNQRADRPGGRRWSTATIPCRIFPVMKITCRSARKNCIFLCWSILSRKMKNFDVYNLVYMKPFGKSGGFCFRGNDILPKQ